MVLISRVRDNTRADYMARHTEDGGYPERNWDSLTTPLAAVIFLAWFPPIRRYNRELGQSPIAALFGKPLTVYGTFEGNPTGSAIWNWSTRAQQQQLRMPGQGCRDTRGLSFFSRYQVRSWHVSRRLQPQTDRDAYRKHRSR